MVMVAVAWDEEEESEDDEEGKDEEEEKDEEDDEEELIEDEVKGNGGKARWLIFWNPLVVKIKLGSGRGSIRRVAASDNRNV